MNIYDELNELPYIICRKIKEKCPHCGKDTERELRYELKIDVWQADGVKRYHIYYESASYGFAGSEVIGENTGFGYLTLEDALAELQRYLPHTDE